MTHINAHEFTRDQNIQRILDSNYLSIARGEDAHRSLVHKFGAGSVGTTMVPITISGTYKTPTAATALEFVSDSVADSSGGSGAREITVQGLDTNWEECVQVIATNGSTPVALPTNLKRLYRWYVSSSGTYATDTSGSHDGDLTIQESGGGDVWDTIPKDPFPAGQSQIGCYTVPKGKTGYLLGKLVFVDTIRSADVYFFQRPDADDVSSPYSPMRLVEREIGVAGGFDHHFASPKNGFVGPCDVGFMAVVGTGTADISVEFELLLIDDGY